MPNPKRMKSNTTHVKTHLKIPGNKVYCKPSPISHAPPTPSALHICTCEECAPGHFTDRCYFQIELIRFLEYISTYSNDPAICIEAHKILKHCHPTGGAHE